MKLSKLRKQLRAAERGRVRRPSLPPAHPNTLTLIPVEEARRMLKGGSKLRVSLALIGPDGKEVAYAGYSRVQVDFVDVDGLHMNAERVDFPAAASSGAIVSAVLVEGAPGTGFTALKETIKLTEPFPVLMAEQPFFDAGGLKVVVS